MVNAAGEASSSRRKRQRQRVPSIVEEEEVVQSGKLLELDLLDCSICFNALTIPIFQCENGHVACSSCCNKMSQKCPSCTLPIGNYRNRIMEKIVKAVIVPCPNAKRGCTEMFSYGIESIHEKECSFALCHCPAPNCNYSGVYKDLYSHYAANAANTANHRSSWSPFSSLNSIDYYAKARLRISEKILVLQYADGPLVAVQCFKEPQGVYVTVNCIAPSAPGLGEFSYDLSYSAGGNTMTFRWSKMNRIRKVSFQTPDKDFMVLPYYFLGQCTTLRMDIDIRKLETDEEEAYEESVDEEESDEED